MGLVMRLTIEDLAREATARGIRLGKNPTRTIRYYVSLGLLQHADVENVGKARVAHYTEDHLAVLQVIGRYKAQGLGLGEIRSLLQQPLYWSDTALEFIEPVAKAKGCPEGLFRRDAPATRESVAFFLNYVGDALRERLLTRDFLDSAFIDKDGRPGLPPGSAEGPVTIVTVGRERS